MEDLNDVVIEALEVFLNHILYVRDVYPGQIFKKRRNYNTPIYVSIYPPLNSYLYKVLRTARELIKTGELECVEMLLYKDEQKEYERYIFRIKSLATRNSNNEDEFLMEFEEQLRSALYTLAERIKGLEKLPSDAKFRVLVYTTQSGFVRLVGICEINAHYQIADSAKNLKEYKIEEMEDLNDVVIEALEVFLNHILYVRDVYPGQIFKKRRIYNTPIYVSIYPPLNSYLYKVLRTARELMKTGELECVEMLLYKDEQKEYERYKFRIKSLANRNSNNEDEFLMEFEEQLRSALYTLAERIKGLEKLPSDAKFRVLVYTTQSGFVRLTHNAHYQDFPWLRADLRSPPAQQEISLLPLTYLKCVGLDLSAEIC